MNTSYAIRSKSFFALLIAQFLSAFGDNAVFVAAIALIRQHDTEFGLLGSFLQASFLLAYILLAPYVGPIADGFAKSRVMLWSNGLKLLGALAMASGVSPILSYALIGVGAAAYSPAKYGILAEMFPESQLIRTNGYLEGSTIVAIILGVACGGKLADISLSLLLFFCVLVYFLAGVANLYVPKIAPKGLFSVRALGVYTKSYRVDFFQFLSNKTIRFSLLGTTTFWSVGTALRLILFAWVPLMFANTGNTLPSVLMGVLSVGIMFGAILSDRWINFARIKRAIFAGVVLGFLILSIVFVHKLPYLFLLMLGIGFCGGLLAVPLNALLQATGHKTIGTGRTLAFQNFCENAGMLVFSLTYGLLVHVHFILSSIVFVLGLLVLAVMTHLFWTKRVV